LPAGDAQRTLAELTPTAVTIAGRDAPLRRLARISATTSLVNRVGPFGPRLPDPNAATPASVTAPSQCRSVSVLTPKPCAGEDHVRKTATDDFILGSHRQWYDARTVHLHHLGDRPD
jgi:hypothetical protein